MSATLIIVFREVLEAALVVGIVLAATRGLAGATRWIGLGILGGVVGAVLVAAFAGAIADAASGIGQELFNATVLFLAVIMLGWHNVWMAREGRAMSQELRALGASVRAAERPIAALALVVGVAVMREGSELVLFLYGIAAAQGSSAPAMLTGGAIGLGLGILAGAGIYFGLLRVAGRYLFTVTSALILFLAAGMAAQGAKFLVQAGYLPPLGERVWDTSEFLRDEGPLGTLLHVLAGYVARPEGIQVVFYLAALFIIGGLMYLLRGPRVPARVAAVLAAGVAGGLIALSGAQPAHAEDLSVYSPIVELRELALETRGNFAFDRSPSKRGAVNSVTEIEATPLSFWHTALVGEMEKEPGGSLEHTKTGWENIFQLTEQGEYWADLGLYFEYEHAHETGAADVLEGKILLEKSVGRLTFTLNPIFEKEIGANATGSTEFRYASRVKYRLNPAFEPALEYHGAIGELGSPDPVHDQLHQLGPVALGKFPLGGGDAIKYEAGYLFGLTHGSPNGAFKFLIEFETHF
jgi:high-affinity iron transporter